MEPQMPGLAACHGKILSPQNAINGTPRHHPISTRSPVCTTKRTKTPGQKRNICETWGRTKKEKLLNWAKYSSVVQTTSFPWQCAITSMCIGIYEA